MTDNTTIPSMAIKASAGCGKTYTMTLRLLAMFIKERKLNTDFFHSANTMTFTKAATAEIYTKLLEHVYKTLKNNSYDELNCNLKKLGFDVPEINREEMLDILKELLYHMSILKINTIDSFMNLVVQSFPFELGLPGNCTIVDSEMKNYLKKKIIRKLFGNKSDKALIKMIQESYQLAQTGEKNKNIFDTVDNLLKMMDALYINHPNFENIAYPDKLDNAAIKARQKQLQQNDCFTICDNHFQDIKKYKNSTKKEASLKELLDKIVNGNLTIDTIFSVKELATLRIFFANWEALLQDKPIDGYKTGWHFAPVKKEFIAILSLARDILITQSAIKAEGIVDIYNKYRELYKEEFYDKGYITFEDLPKLLAPKDNDWAQDVAYRMNIKCKHWLIDEFQDTSRLQWQVLSNMMGIDEERSIFLVGDTKQAIYSWRAGDKNLFGEASEEMMLDASQSLATSYRYGNNICKAINQIFNPEYVKKQIDLPQNTITEWSDIFEEHQSSKPYKSFFIAKQVTAKNALDTYAEIIYSEINRLEILQKGYSCAILVKNNNHGIELQKKLSEFDNLKNKVVWEGSESISENNFLKAIASLLIYLQHPASTMHYEHASMDMAVRHLLPQSEEEFRSLNEELNNYGISRIIIKFIEKLKSLHRIYGADNAETQAISDYLTLANLDNLLSVANAFEHHSSRCDTLEFAEFIKAHESRNVAGSGKIRMMTVFASKGLTFDFCFYAADCSTEKINDIDYKHPDYLYDTENKNLFYPFRNEHLTCDTTKKLIDKKCEEKSFESLCIAYVALTRAKYGMYALLNTNGDTYTISKFIAGSLSFDATATCIIGLEDLYEDMSKWQAEYPIERNKQSDAEKTEKVLEFSFIDESSDKSNHLRRKRINPSKLDGSEPSDSGKKRLYFNLPKENTASNLGNKVHEILAQITNINDFKLPENINDEVKINIQNCMDSPEIRELLTSSNTKDIWLEKKFDCIVNNCWVSGCFDRVNLIRDKSNNVVAAQLIDYKTSIVDEATYDTKLQSYKQQLELYRTVLAQILKITVADIKCFIIFSRCGKVEKF
ncbi:MAG: UvrD-helicase domain-containing protein [Lentisphaeria bacterium]|nr:UvrD-helicase domain-containing protein [Lentisphaeria bacterium]